MQSGRRQNLRAYLTDHPWVARFVALELLLVGTALLLDVVGGPAEASFANRDLPNVFAGMLAAYAALLAVMALLLLAGLWLLARYRPEVRGGAL